MHNRDNFRTRRDDGDNLGKKDRDQDLKGKPAPKSADRESEMTPPENEVTVNLEPDELHLGDADIDELQDDED